MSGFLVALCPLKMFSLNACLLLCFPTVKRDQLLVIKDSVWLVGFEYCYVCSYNFLVSNYIM
ncbi:hypothetical protein DsansV1_C11g0108991 [Dioscorea sansibarensis]